MSNDVPATTGSEAFRLLLVARLQRIEREAASALTCFTSSHTPGQKLHQAWGSLMAIRQSARQTLLDIHQDGN